MFRTSSEFVSFASEVFDIYDTLKRNLLSPQQYRFAYLTVQGIPCPDAELEFIFNALFFEGIPITVQAANDGMLTETAGADGLSFLPSSLNEESSEDAKLATCSKDQFTSRMLNVYCSILPSSGTIPTKTIEPGGDDDKGAALPGEWEGGEQSASKLWAMIEALDCEKKGYISFDDIWAHIMQIEFPEDDIKTDESNESTKEKRLEERKREIVEIFQLCDSDHDERISVDELKEIFKL